MVFESLLPGTGRDHPAKSNISPLNLKIMKGQIIEWKNNRKIISVVPMHFDGVGENLLRSLLQYTGLNVGIFKKYKKLSHLKPNYALFYFALCNF